MCTYYYSTSVTKHHHPKISLPPNPPYLSPFLFFQHTQTYHPPYQQLTSKSLKPYHHKSLRWSSDTPSRLQSPALLPSFIIPSFGTDTGIYLGWSMIPNMLKKEEKNSTGNSLAHYRQDEGGYGGRWWRRYNLPIYSPAILLESLSILTLSYHSLPCGYIHKAVPYRT